MKIFTLGIIAVILVMAASACAGCAGTSPAAPATGGAPPGGQGAAPGTPAQGSSAGGAAMVSGSQLLGGAAWEWTEYKMVTGAGGQTMTVYFKYNQKTGKCTMRIEGMTVPGGSEMDCSSTGNAQAGSDPNDVVSDVKLMKVSTESVTVPAGTFMADKYVATANGVTATYWIVTGKPLIKMTGGGGEGSTVMELNGWG